MSTCLLQHSIPELLVAIAEKIDTDIELTGNLDSTIPFNSIVFRPTSATFNAPLAMIVFTDGVEDVAGHNVVVFFLNVPISEILALLDLELPSNIEDTPGMWVVEFLEGTVVQAICVTDGTNILKPEVCLADFIDASNLWFSGGLQIPDPNILTLKIRLADFIDANNLRLAGGLQKISSNILVGIWDPENPVLMAIEGCDFFFRFTRTELFKFLWTLQERLPLVMSEEPSPEVLDHIATGTLVAFTNISV